MCRARMPDSASSASSRWSSPGIGMSDPTVGSPTPVRTSSGRIRSLLLERPAEDAQRAMEPDGQRVAGGVEGRARFVDLESIEIAEQEDSPRAFGDRLQCSPQDVAINGGRERAGSGLAADRLGNAPIVTYVQVDGPDRGGDGPATSTSVIDHRARRHAVQESTDRRVR